MAFNPQASFSELKRVESFIKQAKTVEDLRYIAATEGANVGYKALGRLLAGDTAEKMKPAEAREARNSQSSNPAEEVTEFDKLVEALLFLDDFFPAGRKPYDYQIDGIRFLVHQEGALLGDEMGLGKCIQAIGGLKILYRAQLVKKALVLCPRPLVAQWERELADWAPELFVQKVRDNQQARMQIWRSGATVHIASYETWRTDLTRISGLNRQYDLVILDEVQKIKQPAAEVTTAVHQIKATYRWGLSGTPLENSIEDVVTIFNFLHPGLFRQVERPYNPETIKRLMRPYFLRRRTSEVQLQLPEKIHKEIWLDLTNEQRKSYESIEGMSRQRLGESNATGMHVFAEINRLKQICGYDEQTGTSSKVEYLVEELEMIVANNQKALVFSQFPQKTLEPIQQKLSVFKPTIYDGSLSDRQGEKMLEAFQEQALPKVLLTSVKSGGTGLNLTRANHVFHFDHWWNPAIAKQAEARAHRIGQKQTVIVHSLFIAGTIEEKIYLLLKEKQSLFDTVIDELTEEDIKGALTLEELFGLFDLEPPKSRANVKKPMRSSYTPSASYAELKRVETLLNEAQTVERVRQIAQSSGSQIGYKAFCYLLGGLSTPELMKGK